MRMQASPRLRNCKTTPNQISPLAYHWALVLMHPMLTALRTKNHRRSHPAWSSTLVTEKAPPALMNPTIYQSPRHGTFGQNERNPDNPRADVQDHGKLLFLEPGRFQGYSVCSLPLRAFLLVSASSKARMGQQLGAGASSRHYSSPFSPRLPTWP